MLNFIKNKEIFSLKLSVTDACNLKCKYCFVNKKTNSLDLRVALKAIDLFLFSRGSKKILIIYGGEPLLYSFLKEVIIYAKRQAKKLKKKIVIAVPTNGTLLNKGILCFLKKNNVKLSISIDGGRKTHNRNKLFAHNKKGTYNVIVEKTPQAFKIIGWENVSALMTVEPKESNVLFRNFKSVIKLGFKNVHIDPVHGVKWNRQQEKHFLINFRKIIKLIIGEINKNNFIYLNPIFSPLNREIVKENIENEICPFYKDLEIYPQGEAAFSQFLLNLNDKELREKFIVGNIKDNLLLPRYQKCQPNIQSNDCKNCWSDYYGGAKDPKHEGANLVAMLRKELGEMAEFIRQKSPNNQTFKKYIQQSQKIIKKNLN